MTQHWVYNIALFTSFLGIVVSTILYFLNKDESFSARLLSLSIFCVSISGLFYGFYFNNTYLIFPHLWRAPVFLTICIPAFVHLYVRSTLKQEFTFFKTDILFFVPAVLYTLNFLPFYLSSSIDKLRFIQSAMQNFELIAKEYDAWLRVNLAVYFRFLYGIVLVSISLSRIFRWRNTNKMAAKVLQNRQIYLWLIFFCSMILLTYLSLIIEYVIQSLGLGNLYFLFALTVSNCIISTSLYLLLRPNILYGIKGWSRSQRPPANELTVQSPSKQEVNDKYTISFEDGLQYKFRLEKHLLNNYPFLKSGYTIRDLAIELNIPSYKLSMFINQEYGKNFNELINEYRVKYLFDLVNADDANQRFTLDALGKMGGFNSRSSFISAVKRYSGKTPSAFFSKKSSFFDT